MVESAERLRAAGLPIRTVAVGSTPTALAAATVPGVTEVRAGTYVFGDMLTATWGAVAEEEIALSILCTVVSLSSAGIEAAQVTGPLAAYLALLHVCGPEALQKEFRPELSADIFSFGPPIPYSYRHPREFVAANVEGTLNVVEAARRTEPGRIVHTSTSEV